MTDYNIGRLEGQMASYEKRLDTIEARMDERLTNIEKYVQEIRDAANMGKGAWWLLLKIGAALMLIIGGLSWLVDKAMGKF